MFWFSGREACGILAPQPGIEPAPPALEGEVLTTGSPGKSPILFKSLYFGFSLLQQFIYLFFKFIYLGCARS